MKTEWFVTDVTAVRSPDSVRNELILGVILGFSLINSGHFCGRRATFLGPNKFTQRHLIKMEWLVTDVTPVRSPDRAECAILGLILAGSFLANSCHICGRGAIL